MPSINETLNLLRADDLLVLDFEFVNLRLGPVTTGVRKLVRTQTGQPALIIVRFPPQHIGEEAFVEDASGNLTNVRELSKSILSGPSRLVFKVPDEMAEVPFTLANLLNWTQYELSVAPNALPRDAETGDEPTEPTPEQTAIEMPYRLLMSPDSSAGWAHAAEPVTHAGRTELWHTRLAVRQRASETATFAINETAEPTVRAIWSRDIDGGAVEPFLMSLMAEQRTEIVRLSSDFTLLDPANFHLGPDEHPELLPSYQPAPFEVERLLLSALGGWLSLSSKWNFPDLGEFLNKLRGHELDPEGTALFKLAEWRHIAAMGRDHYVRTVERGVLCPCGHRASLVTITERKFKSSPAAPREMTAYLAQRKFIVVQEAEKDYRVLSKAYAHDGFEMPLKLLRITTLETPNMSNSDTSRHFRPEVDGEVFRFHLVGKDWSGELLNYAAPLIFVPLTDLTDNDISAIKSEYEADPRNTDIDMQGQNIAFADSPGKPGAATLKTTQLIFRMQVPTIERAHQLPLGHPHFLPFVEQADVNVPAIDQLLGSAGGAKMIRIKFHDTYLNNESNPGGVFAALVSKSSVNTPEKLQLNVPADKAGGLATPNMPVEGLSRSLGPVADPDNIAGGKFDPAKFFGPGGILDAKLLGGVSLADIIEETSDFESFGKQVPKLTTNRLPDAIETRLDWIPRLRNEPNSPLLLNESGKHASTLEIISMTRTPLNGAGSTFNVSGALTNFAINFLDVMTVSFEKLTFVAEKGKKIDVSAAGVDVLFTGPLTFVNELRNILPPSGFSDGPSIAVSPEGVTVGYSLGIPNVGIGVFSLENIALSSRFSLPFVDKPASVRFAVSERQHPFLVTVSLFAGGGFFALAVNTHGIEQIEASIEFGGNFSLNLGVASGGVHILAGIYFNMVGSDVKLTGYVRCGGEVEVLGLISISVEFYLGLTYDIGEQKVWGQASLQVRVKVAFFSASVSLTVERKFGGSSGDPTFEQLVEEADWETYSAAFATHTGEIPMANDLETLNVLATDLHSILVLSPVSANRSRIKAIRRESESDNNTLTDAEALARIFNDSLIQDDGTVVGRLQAILEATETRLVPGLQTGIEFHDIGFRGDRSPGGSGFRDPHESSNNQVGHFLTAVGLTFNPAKLKELVFGRTLREWIGAPAAAVMDDDEVARRLIIGHELAPDPDLGDAIAGAAGGAASGVFFGQLLPLPGAGPLVGAIGGGIAGAALSILNSFQVQFQKTTQQDLDAFSQALAALGPNIIIDMVAAEPFLQPIKSKIDFTMRGNSFQDLRLSLAGRRLGQDILLRKFSDRSELSTWVRSNLEL